MTLRGDNALWCATRAV